jgi:hypothetical protein
MDKVQQTQSFWVKNISFHSQILYTFLTSALHVDPLSPTPFLTVVAVTSLLVFGEEDLFRVWNERERTEIA